MWAEPVDSEYGMLEDDFVDNHKTCTSFIYGAEALDIFLRKNKLISMIRGNEI